MFTVAVFYELKKLFSKSARKVDLFININGLSAFQFQINGKWFTWIDYPRFHSLVSPMDFIQTPIERHNYGRDQRLGSSFDGEIFSR